MKYIIIVSLIAIAVLSRLIEHPANVTCIGAIGLFASAYLPKRYAFTIPLIAMLISDFLTELYPVYIMAFVYFGLGLSVVIGRWLLFNHVTTLRIVGSAFLASMVFFIISNFSMIVAGYYPFTQEGFIECYTLAIPFFKNTLFANLLYSLLLFGSYEAANHFYLKKIPVMQ